jgi:K(+)-stimulated pyrophosphate-energized sodium pump
VILRNPAASVGLITAFLADPPPGELPKRFVLNQVAFYLDSNRMRPESADTIDQLAAVLKAYPKLTARIEGRSELRGDRTLQQRLALDRGNAVKARLEAMGADVSQIETAGIVSDKALDGDAPLTERELANRTEIVITKVR